MLGEAGFIENKQGKLKYIISTVCYKTNTSILLLS